MTGLGKERIQENSKIHRRPSTRVCYLTKVGDKGEGKNLTD